MRSANRTSTKGKETLLETGPNRLDECTADFHNEHFIRLLLTQTDVSSLPKQIASSLSFEDFHVNAISSSMTDFHFSNLMFAAEHHFTPHTTCVFLSEMEELHNLIVSGVDLFRVLVAFRGQLLVHAQEPEPPPCVPVVFHDTDIAEVKPIPKKVPRKGKPEPPPPPPPDPEPPQEKVRFSIADVADITEYTMSFLLQHHKLRYFVFSQEVSREYSCTSTLRVQVHTCASPPPLWKAATETASLENTAKQLAKAHADLLAAETAKKRALLDASKEFALKNEEKEALQRELQVIESNTLRLSDGRVQYMVETAKEDISSSLSARYQKIVERIEALSEKMKPTVQLK
jgi:hypothetical protein